MTLNLGDYESIRPVVDVEDDVLESETAADTYSRLRGEAEVMFMDEARRQGALLSEAHEAARAARKG